MLCIYVNVLINIITLIVTLVHVVFSVTPAESWQASGQWSRVFPQVYHSDRCPFARKVWDIILLSHFIVTKEVLTNIGTYSMLNYNFQYPNFVQSIMDGAIGTVAGLDFKNMMKQLVIAWETFVYKCKSLTCVLL